jgi:DNA polymerase elongation subunit (family B)/predicted transcriptional regulator
MPETQIDVSNERIETFLQGTNPQKYIVAVETTYNENKVTLVINDPETGKRMVKDDYQPFCWFKEEITTRLYGGKRLDIIAAEKRYNVKITRLRVSDDKGNAPARLENGFKFMATCKSSYNDLVNFFKNGGFDVFEKEVSKYFLMFSPVEQYLIQSGKRLYKGMDDYNDVHRLQFDLETEGLFATKHAIAQIGIRDNHGLEGVLETTGNDGYERRDSERDNIEKFFKIIDAVQPDIITGYNSESFDWPFLFERAERLNVPITDLAITLNRISKIKRKKSTVKLGGETEVYQQTLMYGYQIIDISHAVRRAMAINSEIKSWGLKYITQYSEIAKVNRVYVPGDKINTIWADKVHDYAFNDKNGDWYVITKTKKLKPNYVIVKGDYIVQRYLCDDLWETEQIDNIFNQASFLIGKLLPTTYMRSSTMGTAGQWKLIMAAWSYENKLAIPETQPKSEFTGGLSRLLQLGYARNVVKLDYAALYPKTQLTHGIFPNLDISGVMEGMLSYVVDTRDKFKFLAGKEKKKYEGFENRLNKEKDSMSPEEIEALKKLIHDSKALFNIYDKKQLPLKILANSWFGSYGAPYIFNWGDTDSAEETTCRGRQYLRLMVKFFTEKYGFKALVGDTDGFNFSFPENIKEVKYKPSGEHWKTAEHKGLDIELTGLDAVLAEFNESFMKGRMGLDIDDICYSTINFSRKNYANDIVKNGKHKIKLVGNSIKSKKMSVYIEDFLAKAIRMLLDGDGHSFVQFYYDYVDKIYNYQIPLVKIASKAKVKITINEYKKKATLKNKRGNPLPKQAHMELVIRNGVHVSLGDTIYYINTGKAKSHGDLKTEKDKTTGLSNVTLNCNLIDPAIVERDFELIKELEMLKKALKAIEADENYVDTEESNTADIEARIEELNTGLFTDEYNVARYLDAFNKKIKPLLVCFNEETRKNILLDIVKVKDKKLKTVTEKLKDRTIFTKAECELVSGIPNKPGDQDSYEELMTMEDKEIKFWDRVNKIPNNVEELGMNWEEIRLDWIERMRIAKIEGVKFEQAKLDDIFRHMEKIDLIHLRENGLFPSDALVISQVDYDARVYVSRIWKVALCSIDESFKYQDEAIARDEYYQLMGCGSDDNGRFEQWMDYAAERKCLTGDTITVETTIVTPQDIDVIVERLKEAQPDVKVEEPKKKKTVSKDGDDDDDELEEEENEDGEMIRSDEKVVTDDGFDDTQGDRPDEHDSNAGEAKMNEIDLTIPSIIQNLPTESELKQQILDIVCVPADRLGKIEEQNDIDKWGF